MHSTRNMWRAGAVIIAAGLGPMISSAAAQEARRPAAVRRGDARLVAAAYAGDTLRVLELLAAGADPNSRGAPHSGHPCPGTALHAAVYGARDAVVTQLLAAGADANALDRCQGPPISNLDWTSRSTAIARALIGAGARVNVRTSAESCSEGPRGRCWSTPLIEMASLRPEELCLHYTSGRRDCSSAALERDEAIVDSIVQLLLDHGADPNMADATRLPPLHAAALSGRVGAVRLLIAGGARLDARNAAGETALFPNAPNGCPLVAQVDRRMIDFRRARCTATLQVLIDAGADINARTPRGDSPLQAWGRVLQNRDNAIRLLQAAGANKAAPQPTP